MKILITGASGLLGSRMYHILSKKHDVAGTFNENDDRQYVFMDATYQTSVDKVINNLKPDVVIHTAGIADPDTCKEEEQKAWGVNVQGSEFIAEACRRNRSKLVFISTSFVFPSEGEFSEQDEPSPLNYYGKTKLAAEQKIQNIMDDVIIIRAPKIYGYSHESKNRDFTYKVTNKLRQDTRIDLDDKVKRYPVISDDIAMLTSLLMDIDGSGVYHLATEDSYTKYEWGKLIASEFNLDEGLINSQEKSNFAPRPDDLKLKSKKIKRLDFSKTPLPTGVKRVRNQVGCSFNKIYSFRPYELVQGTSATKQRIELGKLLGNSDSLTNKKVDYTVPVPETGIYPAMGYAEESGIPLYHAIIRDYQTEKTLYEPKVEERTRKLREKLIIIPDLVEGKEIVVIDEAVISGLTLKTVVEKLKKQNVEKLHIRIPSPPMLSNCCYGILSSTADLISRSCFASKKLREDQESLTKKKRLVERELEERYGLASLKFLSVKEFTEDGPFDEDELCFECFTSE